MTEVFKTHIEHRFPEQLPKPQRKQKKTKRTNQNKPNQSKHTKRNQTINKANKTKPTKPTKPNQNKPKLTKTNTNASVQDSGFGYRPFSHLLDDPDAHRPPVVTDGETPQGRIGAEGLHANQGAWPPEELLMGELFWWPPSLSFFGEVFEHFSLVFVWCFFLFSLVG